MNAAAFFLQARNVTPSPVIPLADAGPALRPV